MSKTYNGYTPARAKANKKYDAKTYRKFMLHLRLEEDAEIIKELDEAKESGIAHREWLHELYYGQKK